MGQPPVCVKVGLRSERRLGQQLVEDPTLEALAALYRASGWPAEVEGTGFTAPFTAPSGGPPPWNLYRLDAHTVYGVATEEPGGATRWRFTD